MGATAFLSGLLVLALTASAISVNVSSQDSVKSAATDLAKTIIDLYNGNLPGNPIGTFGEHYYWWTGGVVWESMIDYWSLTGDSSYNNLVGQALAAQVGSKLDYMPANQTKDEGNDDQSSWGLAAMTAAEREFPALASTGSSWLKLASTVFEAQAARWDNTTCAGGLRWQIFTFNAGYNYKNALSNGNFFQLAARLAQATSNQTYSDWAEKTYTWMEQVGLVDAGSVFDGTDVTTNCTQISKLEWTATAGNLIYGSAVMYNVSQASKQWSDRLALVLNRTESVFFPGGVMREVACEENGSCDSDQRFYKGLLARSLGLTPLAAPYTAAQIQPLLQSSASAAVNSACNNGTCSFSWSPNAKSNANQKAKRDGGIDLGSQYSAFEVVLSNLASSGKASASGGNSSQGGVGGATNQSSPSSSSSNQTSGAGLTVEHKSAGWFSLLASLLVGTFMCYGL